MSVPYGQPPAAPQPGSTRPPLGDLGLGKLLALVTGGVGLLIYFLTFADDVGGYLRTSLLGFLLVGGGLLAASSVLPKAPTTLVPAAVLTVTGTLFLLIDVTKGPIFLAQGEVSTPGLVYLVLVLAVLESAACVAATLADAGVVKLRPRPSPFPQQSWPQPGYYGGPAQGGYPGQPPLGGSFGGPGGLGGPGSPGGPGGPGSPGGPGNAGGAVPGAGPGGAPGNPAGGPGGGPGNVPGGGYAPPQQSYGPPTVQYYPQQPGGPGYQPGQQPGQPGQSGQPGQGQPGQGGQPGQAAGSPEQPGGQAQQHDPEAGQDAGQQYRPPGDFGPSGQN